MDKWLNHTIALALALRGVWGIYSATKTWKSGAHWAPRRAWIVALEAFFVSASWLPAAALHFGWFAPWMAAPLGVCFLLSMPLPCFIEAVNRLRWLHIARNIFFVLLALLCFAIALGDFQVRRLMSNVEGFSGNPIPFASSVKCFGLGLQF
jgi:hypothetical protein